jgi:hypothetical protein
MGRIPSPIRRASRPSCTIIYSGSAGSVRRNAPAGKMIWVERSDASLT